MTMTAVEAMDSMLAPRPCGAIRCNARSNASGLAPPEHAIDGYLRTASTKGIEVWASPSTIGQQRSLIGAYRPKRPYSEWD
jgi:hypothetical protein